MAKTHQDLPEREPFASPKRKSKPVKSQEARVKQLVALSYDVAEKQLREGKASSQVITHFLKLGTAQSELELEKIRHENALLEAKAQAIESQEKTDQKYEEVIAAIKKYAGTNFQ